MSIAFRGYRINRMDQNLNKALENSHSLFYFVPGTLPCEPPHGSDAHTASK